MDGKPSEPVHIQLGMEPIVRNSTVGNPDPVHSTFVHSADGTFREEF